MSVIIPLAPDQLSALIISVDQAIRHLGMPTRSNRCAACGPDKRSVQHGHVVCLECGFEVRRCAGILAPSMVCRSRILRRWELPSDHPLTAPAYSEQRSAMAKQLGSGASAAARGAKHAAPGDNLAACPARGGSFGGSVPVAAGPLLQSSSGRLNGEQFLRRCDRGSRCRGAICSMRLLRVGSGAGQIRPDPA